MISHETMLKVKFPSDHHAAWFAKHLYINTSSCFGNIEASVDDMVFVLFNALGFNDGELITMYVSCFYLFDFNIGFSCSSRNRLRFEMSNTMVCAEADLTVFNLKTLIRLAVVEV
jgi:hypothetical protein